MCILAESYKFCNKKQANYIKENIDKEIGFVEASIGRMVPVVPEDKKMGNVLRVYVEPYNILPVDKDAFKGEIPSVANLYPYSPFNLFIQRKLFMHNMSHATCAYLGFLKNPKSYLNDLQIITNDFPLHPPVFCDILCIGI